MRIKHINNPLKIFLPTAAAAIIVCVSVFSNSAAAASLPNNNSSGLSAAKSETASSSKPASPAVTSDMREKLNRGLRLKLLQSLEDMDTILDRLKDINRRIGTRIEKIESGGLNLVTSRSLLTTSKSKVLLGRNAVGDAKAAIAEASIASSTNVTALKEILQGAADSVNDARDTAVLSVISLQGLGVSSAIPFDDESASSTKR